MKRRVVLLGPPAAGKGTQAALMEATYGLPVTSPGAMLREERKLGTPLGLEAEKLTSLGRLMPDAAIVQVVEHWLESHPSDFIFDGFPRSLGQADALEEILERRGTSLAVTLALEVSPEKLHERVASRLVCLDCAYIVSLGREVESPANPCPRCGGTLGRRLDDTPETLLIRLEEYRAKTEPLLAYYEERGQLARIDGARSPEEVFASIQQILEAP